MEFNTQTDNAAMRRRAKQEALAAWRQVEPAAGVFGTFWRDYCLDWIFNVYGETFGLDEDWSDQ